MGTKVLIVDDEEDYRVIIRDILSGEGFDVQLAKDGEEGLKKVPDFKPDVILADWMMPKLDGPGLVSALRGSQAGRDIPVIMLTVKQTTEDELEALHFGVDDFIVKPFKSQDLLARIRAVMRRTKA